MTEIYLHIVARMADYIATHPYIPGTNPRPRAASPTTPQTFWLAAENPLRFAARNTQGLSKKKPGYLTSRGNFDICALAHGVLDDVHIFGLGTIDVRRQQRRPFETVRATTQSSVLVEPHCS